MVIPSLFNHNFLSKPEGIDWVYFLLISFSHFTILECDILSDLSSSSRKNISIEVEQNLSYRLMSSVSDGVNDALKKGPLNLPMLLEPEKAVDWKLPTWQHVKWTMHSMAPVFGLSLDSLPSISNAVKIYCLWLKTPRLRPASVTQEYELQFVTVSA
jgi:hypothetical protein